MTNEIIINEEINQKEFFKILNEYYSIKERKDIEFIYELGLKYDDITVHPELKIYYEDYIAGEKIRYALATQLQTPSHNCFDFIPFN